MRTNRSGYMYTPAGSAKALNRKPRPKHPKREVNQAFLFLFFIILPIILLITLFIQPAKWLFVILALLSITFMWLARAFLFPGRMIITAVYGLLTVITLISALNTQAMTNDPYSVPKNAAPTLVPVETPLFASSYSTMGTDVPADYYSTDEGIDDAFEGYSEIQVQGA